MLRYALQQGMRPKAVVFGFFDFQLTHPLEYATWRLDRQSRDALLR